MFSVLLEREIIISATLILSSANAFNLVHSKLLSSGKELIKVDHRQEENSAKAKCSDQVHPSSLFADALSPFKKSLTPKITIHNK